MFEKPVVWISSEIKFATLIKLRFPHRMESKFATESKCFFRYLLLNNFKIIIYALFYVKNKHFTQLSKFQQFARCKAGTKFSLKFTFERKKKSVIPASRVHNFERVLILVCFSEIFGNALVGESKHEQTKISSINKIIYFKFINYS